MRSRISCKTLFCRNIPPLTSRIIENARHLPAGFKIRYMTCECQYFAGSIPAVPLDIRIQLPLPSQPDHRPPTSPFLDWRNDVRFLGGEGRECQAKLISSSNLAPGVQRAWQGLSGTRGELQDRSRQEFWTAYGDKTHPGLGSSTQWERDCCWCL